MQVHKMPFRLRFAKWCPYLHAVPLPLRPEQGPDAMHCLPRETLDSWASWCVQVRIGTHPLSDRLPDRFSHTLSDTLLSFKMVQLGCMCQPGNQCAAAMWLRCAEPYTHGAILQRQAVHPQQGSPRVRSQQSLSRTHMWQMHREDSLGHMHQDLL